jgi:hypothetical protein
LLLSNLVQGRIDGRSEAAELLLGRLPSGESVTNVKSIAQQVRQQVLGIRDILIGSQTGARRAAGQSAIDVALKKIDELAGGLTSGGLGADVLFTAINFDQFADLKVSPVGVAPQTTLAGEVLSSAGAATLTYLGGAGGVISSTGTFLVRGSLGKASVAISEGESLSFVAERVNSIAESTGITATAEGDRLVFQSVGIGSSSTASVRLDTLQAKSTSVSGVNSSQISEFHILNIDSNATEQISGTLVNTIQQAELVLVGDPGGIVQNTANFTISGNLGSGALSITAGESLSDVADRVNAISSATGVTATTSGDTLVFNSQGFGAGASISIQPDELVTVSGVNNSQVTAFQVNSIDAGATHTVSGEVTKTAKEAKASYEGGEDKTIKTDATFTLAGSSGSTSISVVKGESLNDVRDRINAETSATGVVAKVKGNNLELKSVGYGSNASVFVEVTSGEFDLKGGADYNGGKIYYGRDAEAVINGVQYTGNGTAFTITDGTGSFTLDFGPKFKSSFDPIAVTSALSVLNLTGGNGDGTANGLDATATINGQTLSSQTNQFTFIGQSGSYSLTFTEGFVGNFDPITATSKEGSSSLVGGGVALGTDARAVINGRLLTGVGNHFAFSNDFGNVTLEFSEGFQGRFDPVELSRESGETPTKTRLTFLLSSAVGIQVLSLDGLDSLSLGGRAGNLAQLTSGGVASGLGANTEDALAIVDQALQRLDAIDRISDVSSAVALGGLTMGVVSAAIDRRSAMRNQLLGQSAPLFEFDRPSLLDVLV